MDRVVGYFLFSQFLAITPAVGKCDLPRDIHRSIVPAGNGLADTDIGPIRTWAMCPLMTTHFVVRDVVCMLGVQIAVRASAA